MDELPALKRIRMPRGQHVGLKRFHESEALTPDGNVSLARSPDGVDVGKRAVQVVTAEEYLFFGKPDGKRVVGFTRSGEEPQFHTGYGERRAVAAEKVIGHDGSRFPAEDGSPRTGVTYGSNAVADSHVRRQLEASLHGSARLEKRHETGMFKGSGFSSEIVPGPDFRPVGSGTEDRRAPGMIAVTVRVYDGFDGQSPGRCDFPEFFQSSVGTVRYHAGVYENDAVFSDDHADVGHVFGYAEPGVRAELHDMGRKFIASPFQSKGG